MSANDVMEHFAFPGNIDFAADDQGAFHVLFMKGCCVYSSSVKQCLPSVNHEQFPIQMTQNCKHSKCLQILAEEDFPLKLLWRTPIKIHRRADWRSQSRSSDNITYHSEGNLVNTATTNVYRGSDKILQSHCKRNRWREGTPTADASKSDETGSGNA